MNNVKVPIVGRVCISITDPLDIIRYLCPYDYKCAIITTDYYHSVRRKLEAAKQQADIKAKYGFYMDTRISNGVHIILNMPGKYNALQRRALATKLNPTMLNLMWYTDWTKLHPDSTSRECEYITKIWLHKPQIVLSSSRIQGYSFKDITFGFLARNINSHLKREKRGKKEKKENEGKESTLWLTKQQNA